MSSKLVLFITGANTGLGYEAVKALCQTSTAYSIIIGCRTPQKGEDAIQTLKKEVPQTTSELSVVQTDVESDDSIKKAYETISSKFGRVDILINNAGAGFDGEIAKGTMTMREAWNKAWDINCTGTHILTTQFVPLLIKSKDPRLMFITSGTSPLSETEKFDNPNLARINASPDAGWPKDSGNNPLTSYRSSKTGLNMMMRDWHRILLNDGVKVWAISPGFLATGLQGVGRENLLKMGALEPSEGGNFIKDVVQGKRDQDVGKAIRATMIQPW